jgi:heptosyltransferase I
VDRYLAVLPLLGVPVHWNFEWLPGAPQIAAQIEEKWNPGPGPWIVLLPGARWDNKRWPVENFVELVRLDARDWAFEFVVLGGPEDRARARPSRRTTRPLFESGTGKLPCGR